MSNVRRFVTTALICLIGTPALAAEGPSVAGPIGGTDIRSAVLPPPGFYGGAVVVGAAANDFVDGEGRPIAALSEAGLSRTVGGAFAVYVPNVDVLGGSIAIAGFIPVGRQCGRLFALSPETCQSGFGDPYVEAMWSRSFGFPRPSRFAGAYPIMEGLTIALGFGVVVPIGQYDATDATSRALSTGNNVWDFAPSVALTYTSPPVLVDGTEFSTKIYWNNYLENPETKYLTGTLVNIDFAVSERIGRFQAGVAGYYAFQIADDEQFGVPVAPDGQQASALSLGGVVSYDIPELSAGTKLKLLRTVVARNTPYSDTIIFSVFKKFH